jgi:hypothetical protein
VFLDDKDLSLVEEGLLQLQQAALAQQAAHQQTSSQQQLTSTPPATATPTAAAGAAVASLAAAAGVPGVSVPRETQVLLPAAPDTEVPDWFFERTGAELKAEYTAMVRRRQTGAHLQAQTCTYLHSCLLLHCLACCWWVGLCSHKCCGPCQCLANLYA